MAAATTLKHFDISQLPSLKDGMTVQEEAMKRRKTCRFIEEAGRVLQLPQVARSTAMVFFHRFYAKHSFQEHDRFEVAVACIVLAAKTEESPKKLNKVIDECQKLKLRAMQAGRISRTAGAASSSEAAAAQELDPKSEEFVKLKERILLLERVILHTIGFELSVDHPYKFLVDTCKNLVHKRQVEYINKEDAAASSSTTKMLGELMNKMVQYSMNFANDSMHTSLCLQFPPQEIATACVYLAGNFVKVKPVDNKDWLQVLGDVDVETLASIALQMMELISAPRKDPSVFGKIRANLEKLKAAKKQTTSSSSAALGAPKAPPPPPPAAAAAPKKPAPPPPRPPRPPPGGRSPPPDAKRQRVS